MPPRPLAITELVLRDAHQSLLATRMRLEDMLPAAELLDRAGYWSLEVWGGATFDACIRFLGEDPWERLRALRRAMPRTRLQMLLRGQNLLGYRHYADDVVEAFVERAAENGIDVFRIFDALNDLRNLETAVRATIRAGRHAQGTIAYTVSPVHTTAMWVDLARRLEDMGCHSICIKDMAGLLRPAAAAELVTRIKAHCEVPLALHCHATTGMSTATLVAAAEAGIDLVDTAISSMSMTYGHSATESVVAILEGGERDTGLDLRLLEAIAAHFRRVRRRYARFEGGLRGVDSRILVAQVPGGMLTNMENQLREQGALDRLDEVLEEIPRVRKDLGFPPLVTPTSQIVGTQAVLNVLMGERYRTITREAAALLRGEYGATPAPVDAALRARALQGEAPVTGRPADALEPEMERLTEALRREAAARGIRLVDPVVDDVLIYALFPQVGLRFLENRGNPAAFEPPPEAQAAPQPAAENRQPQPPERYRVTVEGRTYDVVVAPGGEAAAVARRPEASAPTPPPDEAEPVTAPLAGHVLRVLVAEGRQVAEGEPLVVLEAMKMETEVRARRAGSVAAVRVREGDAVQVGDTLLLLA
ncbi:sodium-extruding oxaloacetate decarboxylase subunit alpha [Inmirania thermothiophila]|uniref:Oxaloacetate decarboxylase alpha subunit n=1 Tax=Inmirania thermothiophila TaxID=1750597 RepID=A0A3N1Y1E1_9GAMM|nr:sodium-extruding oxaloacetate decarboxylase subunit alpha [Inmirania thermothiophila]ROR32639.1 oxaloacetate decarboxylase alpha subunit [Inmirania thermothiophila]